MRLFHAGGRRIGEICRTMLRHSEPPKTTGVERSRAYRSDGERLWELADLAGKHGRRDLQFLMGKTLIDLRVVPPPSLWWAHDWVEALGISFEERRYGTKRRRPLAAHPSFGQ